MDIKSWNEKKEKMWDESGVELVVDKLSKDSMTFMEFFTAVRLILAFSEAKFPFEALDPWGNKSIKELSEELSEIFIIA